MTAYLYPISLAAISALLVALERLFPWRPEQRQWRPKLWSDAIHLIFNGHFLGLLLAGLADTWLLPHLDAWLGEHGWMDAVYRNAAAQWPLWAQIVVALVVVDFIQWCVHNMLHRVPFLWELHKAHHSVKDGEMDWIVSFRFSWLEVIVYKSVLYLPLVYFGFAWQALMFHAIFGTLIGHLNHSNLDLGHGPWRYVLNSPRMHIWHHDYEGDAKTTVNYGIIFSTWDWIFGTAKMPQDPPKHLGFAGVETFPDNFFSQEVWPLQRLAPGLRSAWVWSAVGVMVMGVAWYLHTPHTSRPETPMLGEVAAASQPLGAVPAADAYATSPADAEAALSAMGHEAREAGYRHPDSMVSVAELARSLGAPSLVLLDVRPAERYEAGHLPGARRLDRGDYSNSNPVPGTSRDRTELEALLQKLGVDADSRVVLYGDGGPEPYRLWWTLRTVGGYETRVLDGGLSAWKAAGHYVAGGSGLAPHAGNVELEGGEAHPPRLWADVRSFVERDNAVVVDTRSAVEYKGEQRHPKAARAGRIPGAIHLDWTEVLRDPGTDHRMRAPAELRALFGEHGLSEHRPVLTYCQSGTRSAAVYYALYQAGFSPQRLLNYDGSWAEYSRLAEAIEP